MIGINIEKLLQLKGKSIYWLSKESGVSWGNIKVIIVGSNKNPTMETLAKIAQALDVPITALLEN